MSNIFIIHGTGGNPEENWFPWLKAELEKFGHKVFVPLFPTPEGQNLNNWLEVLNKYQADINEETIFIGHSLGAPFILNFLARRDKPIKAAFLIAGFINDLNIPEFQALISSFVKDFAWEKIKNNCRQFFVIYSDNDPYVSLQKAQEVSDSLQVEPLIITGAGHFNKASGYTKFDLLLEKVKTVL